MPKPDKLDMIQAQNALSIPDERQTEIGYVQAYEGNGQYSVLINGKIILARSIQRTALPIGSAVTITVEGIDYL